MNITEMYGREDVVTILCDTLTHFFSDIYGKKVVFSAEKNGVALYLTNRPGILGSATLHKGAWETLLAEYSLRGNIFKFLIARGFIITQSIVRSIFYHEKIYYRCEDDQFKLDNFLIIPNNKSVRIFDYDAGVVYSVLKSGFSPLFLKRQVSFRITHHSSLILPMIDYGEDWFSERIMHGHALARVRNQSAYNDSKKKATEFIKELFTSSKEEIEFGNYANLLREKIEILLGGFETSNTNFLQSIKHYSEKLLDTLKDYSGTIEIGLTHGDFQEGNIWRESNGETFVYDWETVQKRSSWYDFAVMFSGLRKGMAYNELNLDIDKMRDFCGQSCCSQPEIMTSIVCLEDIIFQLEEASVLPKEIQDYQLERLLKCIGLGENQN